MSPRTVSSAILFTLCMAGAAAADTTWQEFKSAEGRLTVLFPGEPKLERTPVDVPNVGKVEEVMWTYELKDVAMFGVAWVDYPKELVAQGDRTKMLDGARDGAAKNIGGKIVSEKPITMHGFPGRELKVEVPKSPLVFLAQIYLVNERLYQVILVTTASHASAPEVTKFFASFKFDPPAKSK